MKRVALVLLTAALSIVGTLLAQNFSGGERHVKKPLAHQFDVASERFPQVLSSLSGAPLLPGNRVDALQNGEQIFPAMLEAIHAARRSINFETYIYWEGEIGRRFTDALVERVKNGVKVHVIVDWVGASRLDEELEKLEKAGAEIEKYHPPGWHAIDRMNNRTHRKLLVIDGKIGFTGGVGIADPWQGDGAHPDGWRDSHYRLEGPAVAEMQAAFLDNWLKTRGEALTGADYFPPLERAGDVRAQVIHSSSEGGAEEVRLVYALAIASAARTIDLESAYFVPDQMMVNMLLAAVKRGVRVRIIVPAHTDTRVVQKASRALWGTLLDGGVSIWQYQPAKFHMKVMIVDDLWVSVGSTNFDERSFKLNDEANLDVFDGDFARAQEEVFARYLGRSHRVTRDEWCHRSLWERIVEKASSILHSQL